MIEVAHGVQRATAAVEWQVFGVTDGARTDWKERNTVLREAINRFHEYARRDLGVNGSLNSPQHTARACFSPRPSSKVKAMSPRPEAR